MKRSVLLAAIVLLFPAEGRPKESALAPLEAAVASLETVVRFDEVAISPDGTRVAWVQRAPRSSVFVAGVGSGAAARRLGDEGASATAVAWSPDGTRLAFLSDAAKPGQKQLLVASASGGSPRRLTHLTGFVSTPRWSPDGTAVAILFIENARAAAGPLASKKPETGVVGEQFDVQRLAVVDAADGSVRFASPPDLNVYEYDWAPDGKRFVVTAAPPPADNNWYVAELLTIDAATRRTTRLLKPEMQMALPRWSPDGGSIAFVGGLMSDEPVPGGDVFLVPASGGEARNLTPGLPASASGLVWRLDSKQLVVAAYHDGGGRISTVDVAGGSVTTLWTGAETVSANGRGFGLSMARDGMTSAIIRHSYDRAPEVWVGPIGAWKPVTRVNGGARRAWGDATAVRWENEGRKLQGWLVRPARSAGGRHPMVVDVHGGPAGARSPHWPQYDSSVVLASLGYYVFSPNARGSLGWGEDFTRANVRDLGGGDFRDILSGVDAVLRTNPVDGDRLAVMGGSYGGFMTLWAVTQTRRFRAAVADAPISNWQSYWGQNGIEQWMLPYFGATVYDDPAVYARSSPIHFVKNVATPTLLLVGEGDIECPPPQSHEFWRALRRLGVPSELVVYPDEGHGFVRPDNRRDALRRRAAWLAKYLGGDVAD